MRLHAPSPFHACQVLAGPMSGGDGEPKARSPKWLISCSADATATTLLQTSASAASITAQPTPVGGHVLPPSCACPCGAPCCVPIQRRRDRGKPRRGLIRASCILPSFLPAFPLLSFIQRIQPSNILPPIATAPTVFGRRRKM